ncbi:MAG: PKD domain-containing protein [Firmicutes bacterium]|nr:PKD domain-containing protein [Bacillota bacterium]
MSIYLRGVLIAACWIGMAVFLQVPAFAGTYIEHNLSGSGIDSKTTAYLPTSSNNPIYSFSSVKFHPVTVRVFYQAAISDTIYYSWLDFYVEMGTPSISAKILNRDGSTYQDLAIADGPGASRNGSIDIPPGKALSITLDTGMQQRNGLFFDIKPYSVSVNLKYKWDDAAPNAPELVTPNPYGNQVITLNGKTYTGAANPVLRWSATDKGATYLNYTYGPSGIKDYLLDCNGSQQWTTNTQLSLGEGEYQIKVKARDQENNEGPFSSITLAVDRSINKVTLPASPVQVTPGLNGTYNVNFSWNPVQTDLSGIKKYQVALTNFVTDPSNGWLDIGPGQRQYTFANQSVANIPLYIQIRAVDNVNNTSDWTKTAPFKIWSPAVTLKAFPSSAVQNGQPVYSVELQLGNDPEAAQYVINREGPGQFNPVVLTYQQLAANGFKYTDAINLTKHAQYRYNVYTVSAWGVLSETTYSPYITVPNIPAAGIETAVQTGPGQPVTGECVTTNRLTFEINKQTDVEGDTLYYQLYYENIDTGATGAIPASVQTGPVSVASLDLKDGRYEFWLAYQEYSNGGAVSDINTTPHLSIRIDTTPPAKPEVTISPSGRTNNTRPEIIFSATDSGSGVNRYELAIDGGEYSTVTSPYALPPQPEGERQITVRAIDNAGLASEEAAACVTIDLTSPGAPAQFRHTFGDGGQMAIRWQCAAPSDDLSKFVAIFTPPFGIGTVKSEVTPVIVNDTKTGVFNILLTGFAPNQPVTIEVYSVDLAGNNSVTVSYTAYTPAALGAINFLGADYDPAAGHQLKWQVESIPGQAQSHALEYGNITGEGFAVLGRVYAGSNGLIIHNALAGGAKLQAHATYHYRLAAFNNSGDPSYGDPFDMQVPNIAPAQPEAISPLQYARTTAQFTYHPATDPDGDPLTYQIYLGKGANPAAFDLLPDGTAGGLIPGQTYTWYITATDSYGAATKSGLAQFTVDGNAPELAVTEPRRPYTNQNQLRFTASDDFSGIDKVTWQRIDAATNLLVETGVAPLDGASSGTIPLAEGNCHIQIIAWDKAGNSKEVQVNNLMVDHTKPVLTSLNLKLTQSSGRYISGSRQIPVEFSASDGFSGTGGLLYTLAANQNQPLDNNALIQLRPGFGCYSYQLEAKAAQTGQEYFLAAAILDAAGNCSDIKYYGPIIFDLTPPAVDLKLEGFSIYGAANYLTDLHNLNATLTATDPETNILRAEVAIAAANQTMVSGWGDWAVIQQNTSLVSGSKYRILVRAENGAGLITVKSGPEFIYDNTPPVITSIQGPAGTLAGGEQAVFTINAQDPESGVTKYRLAICRDTPDGEKLTSLTPGAQNGWIIIQATASPREIRLELPMGASGTYYPVVQATNGAGLTGYQAGAGFTLIQAAEKINVADQGPYSMFCDRLNGFWKYLGTSQITGYRYRILGPDQQSITDWQNTTGAEATVTGLNLEPGKTYRFEVQAQYSGGSYTEPGYSPGVMIDATPPEIGGLVVPECATSDNLWFQWTGNDGESGIGMVQAALGSDYYQTDVTGGWVTITGQNTTLACTVSGGPLKLETGKRYYLSLRLANGAGLTAEAISTGIIIDDTPPPAPVVFDQGAYINPNQPLQANWFWSPEDPESGPNSYQWTLIKDGQNLNTAVWQTGNEAKRIEIAAAQIKELFPYLSGGLAPDGSVYYFAVRVANQAGLSSIGMSNGIMADSTAPYIPEVKLINAVNLGDPQAAEVNYITNNQNLGLWISSFDPEAPIDQYLYAWGDPAEVDAQTRRQSEQSQIQLDNPQINEGEITLFAGECSNKAQLVSATGYSSGVVLDTGAPKIINVHGGVCGNRLLFDWDVIPSISPVAFYEVALVKSSDVNSIPSSWVNTGLKRSVAIDSANIADGKYCLLIRATNQAGSVSRREETIDEWGKSPVVMLDRTPPEIVNITYDKYTANQLKLQIEASDNLAGINGYQYAVGSLAEPFKYSGGWTDINSQSEKLAYSMDTGNIPHNSAVYLMVRCADKAGLWSRPAISAKIIIDHSKPETPSITSGQYATSKTVIGGIQFASQDPESGLTHYRLGIMSRPGTEWLAVQVRPINEFDGQITGLNLAEGATYYLAVQVQNGAGDWSDTGFSGPITVDTTGPELLFTNAGSVIVINRPPVDIGFTLSEAAQVQFDLTAGNGAAAKYTMDGKSGLNKFTFNESRPDTYTLSARAIDPAGNTGYCVGGPQIIRVNAPPQVVLPTEINATPGQPLTFTAAVIDPDGVPGDIFSYQWDPGAGNGLLTGPEPQYRYTRTGEYTLTLTVTDKDGGVATGVTTVKIANTSRGALYMDEVWSGEHHIYADVTVPEGIHLTISPGTRVIIDGMPGAGYNHALIIQGGLTAQSGCSFQSANNAVENGWKGIYITGEATLEGANIYHALRGITVMNAARVTASNCGFIDNYIGIHVYGSRPRIDTCQFANNQWYGIKEDQGGRPIVVNCGFTGNEVGYYQDGVSEISMDDLNRIPGNIGNCD